MFILEPTLRFVDLQGKVLLTLAQSINQPMVAASDYPAEETQAFVVSVQKENRTFETFIYLHLLETNQSVIYRFSENPFSGEKLENAENEALEFVESMGFMVDNLRYNKISSQEQETLRKEIPLFYPDLSVYEPILAQRRQRRTEELDRKVQEFREVEPEDPNLINLSENAMPVPEPSLENMESANIVEVNEADGLIPALALEPEPAGMPSPDETQELPGDDSLVRLFDPGFQSVPPKPLVNIQALDAAGDTPEESELNELAEMEAGLARKLVPEQTVLEEEVTVIAQNPQGVSEEERIEKPFEISDQEWRVIFGLLLNL